MGRLKLSVCLLHGESKDRQAEIRHFDIDDMDFLGSFSNAIAAQTGKFVSLTYKGLPISSAAKVYHFAPVIPSTIRFVARLTDTAPLTATRTTGAGAPQVFVKLLTGKTITVTLSLYNTMGALKDILASREGCPPETAAPHLCWPGVCRQC